MAAKKTWTVLELEAALKGLGLNMLDCKLAATEGVQDPDKEYKTLKVMSHKQLLVGRDFFKAGNKVKANNNFAFAFQMRRAATFIWEKVLGRKNDAAHANFEETSKLLRKACHWKGARRGRSQDHRGD
jgi:hypothetical protein